MTDINYKARGSEIRSSARQLVLDFMQASSDCEQNGEGLQQAEISRSCGLEWGDYPKSSASQQQYWTVGLLRELEQEEIVQRDPVTKKWRLK